MKISVTVPSFNYVDYIEQCLYSIKIQNYNNYEVLICDGGSTDGSLDVINRYCKSDDRFKLVSTSDCGQSDAIIKSIPMASGDILCFLNSDDCYLSRDVFDTVVKTFLNYDRPEVISFRGMYIDEKGDYIREVNLRYHPFDNTSNMKYRTAVLQPATFWLKEVAIKTPLEKDSHYVFDSIFFYQVYQKYSWLDVNKMVAGHRLHGLNKSLQICPERINELSEFERIKFGRYSLRFYYLMFVSLIIRSILKIPVIGVPLSRVIYFLVNTLSFVSYYRIPSI